MSTDFLIDILFLNKIWLINVVWYIYYNNITNKMYVENMIL